MSEILGFNNLTKSLSFNLYDLAVALNNEERVSYLRYIDERYNAKQMEAILIRIAEIINAQVLNISSKDFDPHGASVVLLMSDINETVKSQALQAAQSTVSIHLDKSHICAHTYPDSLDPNGICSFRVDIDIATCGSISPLHALNFMFEAFESDIVCVDYVVRGFARTTQGKKIYIDHEIKSIKDFIAQKILNNYTTLDKNAPEHLTFQTTFARKDLDEHAYFRNPKAVNQNLLKEKMKLIRSEMDAIVNLVK